MPRLEYILNAKDGWKAVGQEKPAARLNLHIAIERNGRSAVARKTGNGREVVAREPPAVFKYRVRWRAERPKGRCLQKAARRSFNIARDKRLRP